jgi:hypothetical protein
MLAQKPSTSWRMSAFIACISTEDSVGRVYLIFASLVTHAMTTYFCATICWGAFIPISDICTAPLPLLVAMEKPIRHWIKGPLSIWKVWTSTTWTPKFESVPLSQMIGLITYGTFKNHKYIHIRKYIYTSVFDTLIYWKHVELLTMLGWLNGTFDNTGSNPIHFT